MPKQRTIKSTTPYRFRAGRYVLVLVGLFAVMTVTWAQLPLLTRDMRLQVASGATVSLIAPTETSGYSLMLPTTYGVSGAMLTANGAGTLYWTVPNGAMWMLTGNSGTSVATNFIGTTDGQPLSIRTNNVERLRITSDGSIGIGMSVPTHTLDVTGTFGVSGNTTLGGATSSVTVGILGTTLKSTVGSNDRIVLANSSGQLDQASISSVIAAGIGSNAWTLAGNSISSSSGALGAAPVGSWLGSTTNQDLRIATGGLTRMIITSDGSTSLGGTLDVTALITGLAGATVTGPTTVNASGSSTTSIGTGTNTGTVTIGGSAAQTIDIGTGAAAKAVLVGSTNTTSTTTISSGSGGVNINTGTSTGPTSIGTGSSSGTVTIGRTGGTITTIGTIGHTGPINSSGLITGNAGATFTGGPTSITGSTTINTTGTSGTFIGNTGASVTIGSIGLAVKTSVGSNDRIVISNSTGVLDQASIASVVAAGVAGNAWSLTGNDVTEGTNFLGTTTAKRLELRTGNTERMRITSDGLVLIGTTSGTNTLEVGGTLRATGLITGTAGATISGAASSINASSNFNTSINTGSSTGVVSIGNSASTTTMLGATTINSTGTSATTIGATGSTVTIGSIATTLKSTLGLNDRIVVADSVGKLDQASIAAVVSAGLGGNVWLTNGNSTTTNGGTLGSTPTGNFLGTTNASGLSFVTQNVIRAEIDTTGTFQTQKDAVINTVDIGFGNYTGLSSSSWNLRVGYGALDSNTTGFNNLAIGHAALRMNKGGFDNVAVGINALTNAESGYDNIAIGREAMGALYQGNDNIAIGDGTLGGGKYSYDNIAIGRNAMLIPNPTVGNETHGMWNVAIGEEALMYNYSVANVAIGYKAAKGNTLGQENVAVGTEALTTNIDGWRNVAVGANALQANTTGGNNVALGAAAMFRNTTGSRNIAIGYRTMESNTKGSDNVVIGYDVGFGSDSASGKLLIDNSPGFGSLIYGDFTSGKLGVNMVGEPKANLHVTTGSNSYSTVLLVQSVTGNPSHIMNIQTDSTSRLVVSAAGNVGVGATTPTQRLHVSGGNALIDTSAASTAGQLQFMNPARTFQTNIRAGAQTATITYTLPTVAPTSGQSLTSDASGNLSWSAALSASTGWMLAGNSTADAWDGTSGSRLGTTSVMPLVLATTNAVAQDIWFFTGSNGANERMRITGAGLVLIGATSGTNTLEVGGTLRATGLITGTAGATISGAASSINASSNFNTSINTGSSTGVVSIGNAASTTAMLGATTINTTGTSATTIGSTTASVTIGSVSGAAKSSVGANDRIVLANGSGTLDQASIASVVAAGVAGNAWSLTGNPTTDSTLNFVGTTDETVARPLVIRTDGTERARFAGGSGYAGFATASPNVQVDVNGGLATRPATATASSATTTVTIGNRSFVVITSDDVFGSRKVALTDGLQDGQRLVILVLGSLNNTTYGVRLETADANLSLSGDAGLEHGDTIELIYYSGVWRELRRSANDD